MAETTIDGTPPDTSGNGGGDEFASGGGAVVDGYTVFDPASVGGTPNDASVGGDAPRKRGRKPGSKNGTGAARTGAQKASTAVAGIEKLLLSLHTMAAVGFQAPELVLAQDDAKLLAEAMVDVAEQYSVTVDPKVAAWAKLCMVAGTIYGGRILQIHLRRKSEKKPKPVQEAAEVFTFNPNQGVMPK